MNNHEQNLNRGVYMNLKVSEIVDITGVSRNKIYRFIKENKIKSVQNSNPKQYDEHAQELIIKHFGKNNEQNQTKVNNNKQSEQNQTKENNNEQNSEQFISVLIEQIKEKDEQIKKLGTLLEHQQELTLNDKKVIEKQEKKIELLTVHDEQEQTKMNNNEQKKKKKSFFDFFK